MAKEKETEEKKDAAINKEKLKVLQHAR